jgi:hypothetical protein
VQSDQQIVGGLEVCFPTELTVVLRLLADVDFVPAGANGAVHDRHVLTAHLPHLFLGHLRRRSRASQCGRTLLLRIGQGQFSFR